MLFYGTQSKEYIVKKGTTENVHVLPGSKLVLVIFVEKNLVLPTKSVKKNLKGLAKDDIFSDDLHRSFTVDDIYFHNKNNQVTLWKLYMKDI